MMKLLDITDMLRVPCRAVSWSRYTYQ